MRQRATAGQVRDQRQPAEIVAIEEQEIEGTEDDAVAAGP